jgi:hypothetical protein
VTRKKTDTGSAKISVEKQRMVANGVRVAWRSKPATARSRPCSASLPRTGYDNVLLPSELPLTAS